MTMIMKGRKWWQPALTPAGEAKPCLSIMNTLLPLSLPISPVCCLIVVCLAQSSAACSRCRFVPSDDRRDAQFCRCLPRLVLRFLSRAATPALRLGRANQRPSRLLLSPLVHSLCEGRSVAQRRHSLHRGYIRFARRTRM